MRKRQRYPRRSVIRSRRLSRLDLSSPVSIVTHSNTFLTCNTVTLPLLSWEMLEENLEIALFQSQQNVIQAKYELLLSKVDLDKALGK